MGCKQRSGFPRVETIAYICSKPKLSTMHLFISCEASVAPTTAGHLRHRCVSGQILMGPSALRAAVTYHSPATTPLRPSKCKRSTFGQLCGLSQTGRAAMADLTTPEPAAAAALESCAFVESVDARPASTLSKKQRSKVIARVTRKSLTRHSTYTRAYLAPAEGFGLSGVE